MGEKVGESRIHKSETEFAHVFCVVNLLKDFVNFSETIS